MMNPIGIRNEHRTSSRDPWLDDRTTAVQAPEHGGAGPGGTRVRRSAWAGWRSATGRSCGRRAPAAAAWTRPSATTPSTPDATHGAPASTSAASSVPPPGRAPPSGSRRCPQLGAGQPPWAGGGTAWARILSISHGGVLRTALVRSLRWPPCRVPRNRLGTYGRASRGASRARLQRKRPASLHTRSRKEPRGTTSPSADGRAGRAVPLARLDKGLAGPPVEGPRTGTRGGGSPGSARGRRLPRVGPGRRLPRLGRGAPQVGPGRLPRWGGGRRLHGRACTSCRSRRGRVGCGRPSCRPGVGAGWRRRVPRLR
jgi:hypothetical protein